MNKYNSVVVGCGVIAPIHIAAILGSENANLYGVCDIDIKRATTFSEKYSCKSFTSIEDVLKDNNVDCVHICTPHYLHKQMAIKSARAKKNIVLEKPAAMNTQEAIELKNIVEIEGVKCCAVLQNRINPSIIKAKQMLNDGTLGKMLGIKGILTWNRTKEYYMSEKWRGRFETEGGGLLINQAIHMLDLMYYLGGDIDYVKGFVDTRVLGDVIEVEDNADATLYYTDGKNGVFFATNCNAVNTPFHIEIYFENCFLRYLDSKLTLNKDGEESITVASDTVGLIGKSYWGVGHQQLIANFYKSIADKTQNYTTLSDAEYSMRLLDAIYISAKSGKKEKV